MVQRKSFDLYLARTAGMLSGARRVAITLLVMMLTMTAQTAWAQDPPQYPPLPDPDGDGNVTLVEPFYSVTSDVNISGNITANNPVNLTISNGATLSLVGHPCQIQMQSGTIDVQGGTFIGQDCSIDVNTLNMNGGSVEVNGLIFRSGTIQNATVEARSVGMTAMTDNITITGSTIVSNVILADGVTFSGSNVTVNGCLTLSGAVEFDASSPAVSININEYNLNDGSLTISNGSLKDADGNIYTGAIANPSDLNGKTLTYYNASSAITVSLNAQGGSGGTESVNNATFGLAMPAITPPTRTDCEFVGYYTETNGGGTKYYNADGSSARTWGIDANTTLYAYWKKYLNNADITIEIPAQTYNGSELTPVVTVKDNGIEVSAAHYDIILPEGRTNAGDYTINIEAKEGSTAYVWTTQATFTINKKALTVTANPKTITYGDAPANDGVTYSGFVNGENESVLGGTLGYTYNTEENGTGDNYTASSPVGTYYIIPSGLTATNYDITFANGTLTVNPKSVTVTGITVDNKTYDGTTTAALNAANATVNGKVGEDNVTVNIDNATAVFADANAGTGKAVTITGVTLGGDKANNYTLSDQPTGVTGTIDKDASSVTAAPTAQSLVYNGSEQTLINAGTASGGTMNYSLDNSTWSTALPTATDAGEYTVYYKVEGDGNHNNTDAASIMAYIDYTIDYDLDGGSVASANPTRYNVTTATFTLTNPTRVGYDFAGWTGTGLTDATETVTIDQGSTGNRSYTATWTKTPVTTSYIDENGIEQTHAATEIDGSQTNLPGGWYVVNSDVALTTKLNFTGDTHLILADGKTLSIDASSDSGENNCYFGLSCKEGTIGIDATYHDLTIYGQAEGTGKVTANHGHPGYATSYAYYAHSITINGGVVEATSSGIGFCGTNITINGGQILFNNNNNNCAEIMAGNSIVLGWRKPSDFIQAYRFVNPGGNTTIQIANGKVFTDGTNVYDNTTTTGTLESLVDVTLRPITGVTLTKDGSGNITATFDGNTLNETFSIPCDLAVNDVQFNRTFNEDKKTCICWPFAVSQEKANTLGKFYQFTGVTGEGKIEMTQVTTGGLEANKPYIFEPGSDISTAIDFGAQTLKAGGAASVGSGFTFKGIYKRVKWTTDTTDPLYDATYEAELGKAYGFALEDLAGYSVGQFVKLGSGAHSRPFRAYLLYDGAWDGNQPSARTRGANSGTSLPDVLDIVWISGNSQTTGIETITTSRETDEWYSLDGRKLSGMPATKGLYIHNGRKEVLK